LTIPRYFRIVLAVLWTAFIFYGLTTEPSGIPRFAWLVKPGVDKIIHAILFTIEAGILVFIFEKSNGRKTWLAILSWCFILGGGLEIVQHFWIEGRSGDFLDLLADMVGGIFGIIASRFNWKGAFKSSS
jgi:VanZ family protein